MIEVNGEYNKAIIYSNSYDEGAYNQLLDICNYKHFEGANIKVMPDYHAGKGCVIGFTSVETPVLIPNLIGVDIGCLDGETEVLTENGWIKIKDFDVWNPRQILIYDKETDSAIFDYPLEYIKQPCDKFYHLKTNGGLDQAVCENHRILAWLGDKSHGYELRDYIARDFVAHHNSLKKGIYGGIKTTFNLQHNGINNFPDIYLRLNIMISADGTLRTNIDGTQRVELHFKKQRKIDRALYLLTQAGIPYSVTEGSNGSTYIYFKNKTPQKFKFSKDLCFIFKLSQKQLKVVIDECRYWDGTLNKRGQVQYSTSIKENADAIQYAFAVCGIRAGINITTYSDKEWQDTYNVYETYNEIVRFPERKINEIPSLDGFKYCFRTATGYFVIRRNNRISITGNCGVLAVKLSNPIDVKELDNFIRRDIPSGFDVNEEIQPFYWFVPLEKLNCFKHLNKVERLKKSLGSLGGGELIATVQVNSL